MRVAFDVGPLKPEPAGVGIYVRELADAVAPVLGPDQLRFVGALPGVAGLPHGIPTEERRRGPYSVWVLTSPPKNFLSGECDVIHNTDGLVPLRRRRPTVVTIQDLTAITRWRDHRIVRVGRIPFVLAAPRLAHAVVTPSLATADEIMRRTGTRAHKIVVVPLAARPVFRPRAEDEVARACSDARLEIGRYVLVPGTVEPRKNGLRTIRAFEIAISRGGVSPEVQLVFAGGQGWGSGAVIRAAHESPMRDRIKFVGYVEDVALAALMTGAAGVVYMSLAEGFGLPVLEGMACGAPVLTSNRSSMPEVAGDAAWKEDPTDVAAIAGRLSDLVRLTATARASLSDAGRSRAAGYSWARTAAETIAVYRAVA